MSGAAARSASVAASRPSRCAMRASVAASAMSRSSRPDARPIGAGQRAAPFVGVVLAPPRGSSSAARSPCAGKNFGCEVERHAEEFATSAAARRGDRPAAAARASTAASRPTPGTRRPRSIGLTATVAPCLRAMRDERARGRGSVHGEIGREVVVDDVGHASRSRVISLKSVASLRGHGDVLQPHVAAAGRP